MKPCDEATETTIVMSGSHDEVVGTTLVVIWSSEELVIANNQVAHSVSGSIRGSSAIDDHHVHRLKQSGWLSVVSTNAQVGTEIRHNTSLQGGHQCLEGFDLFLQCSNSRIESIHVIGLVYQEIPNVRVEFNPPHGVVSNFPRIDTLGTVQISCSLCRDNVRVQ